MWGEANSYRNCPQKENEIQNVPVVGDSCRQLQKLSCLQGASFQATCGPNQISYTSIQKQASPPPPNNTFNFTADQIVSLVTNVVIQVALLHLCTKRLPEKSVQAKSDLSRQIAETAKNA